MASPSPFASLPPSSDDHVLRLRRVYRLEARHLQRTGGFAGGVAAMIGHVAVAVAVALPVAWTWPRSPLAAGALYVLAVIWIGVQFRALGNMLHECSHHALVRGRSANELLGHMLSFLVLEDFSAYTHDHRSHHLYLGDPERDLDLRSRRALFERLGPFGPRYVWTALTLRHLPGYLRPFVWTASDSLGVRAARTACVLGMLVLAQWGTGWPAFALFFVVPYVTTYQMLRLISDGADHAGLLDGADELERSRNHALRLPLANRLVFPRNDQFHLVHHLFPAVTTKHLPRLHQLLLGDPVYGALAHDLKGSPR